MTMSKIFLYLKNLAIAVIHIPMAVVGKYKYNPQDSYGKNLLIAALDLPLNTLLGGDPNETLSSRSGKAMAYEQQEKPPSWGWGCRLCSFLAMFQENHCQKAIERNVGNKGVVSDDN